MCAGGQCVRVEGTVCESTGRVCGGIVYARVQCVRGTVCVGVRVPGVCAGYKTRVRAGAGGASGCVFVSLALAGRQEERRANRRARFHKSWVLIGRQGKGIANKEKSLSGTARSEAPTPPPRPLPWGQRPCPLCL